MSSIITSQSVPTGTWSADPVHSNVSFEVAYAGTNTFRGSFRDFTATLADGVLEGSAKVGSVDVKDEQLNGHLQTPDFFDAERFPEISFRATDLDRGELTIKGVTRPVELTGSVSEPNVDPFGRERVGIKLETTVDRNEFGVSWNAPNQGGGNYLGDQVKLIAELAFVKQEA
ncbi:MAG: YceI family protein [Actinobacteria bacterium]|nr:MAG: YceI family protein [Actinomycetota bacterium]